MILYVNGDSHTAAAEAVNGFAFANDDIRYVAQGRRPHPDNLAVSWGMRLSKLLNLGLKCDAESASSNDRIIRTTREFLSTLKSRGNPYTVVVIGWSTWEREEWYDDENHEWYQVTASGIDDVPEKWRTRYKQYVATADYYEKEKEAQGKILGLHWELEEMKIPHLFFNAMWHFHHSPHLDWNGCYLEPHDPNWTFTEWAKNKDFPNTNGHYGPEAQQKWADILFSRLTPMLNAV